MAQGRATQSNFPVPQNRTLNQSQLYVAQEQLQNGKTDICHSCIWKQIERFLHSVICWAGWRLDQNQSKERQQAAGMRYGAARAQLDDLWIKAPMNIVSMDLLGLVLTINNGNCQSLFLVDYFTQWAETFTRSIFLTVVYWAAVHQSTSLIYAKLSDAWKRNN